MRALAAILMMWILLVATGCSKADYELKAEKDAAARRAINTGTN
jgi:hypothetical protein